MGTHLIEDTRQQAGKHEAKHGWFEANGVAVTRSKLAVGDYAAPPSVAVDTKMSVQELAADVWQQHERFRREVLLARAMGTRLVVLVENDHGLRSLDDLYRWREPDRELAKRGRGRAQRISGVRLYKACETMRLRYGVEFEFCAPEDSARRIVEILGEVDHGGGDDG